MGTAIADIAAGIEAEYRGRSFGIVRFWRFAVVRPNDQRYELVAVRVEGERLDLVLRHDLGQHDEVLSLWSPEGLEDAFELPARGFSIRHVAKLAWGDNSAWPDGDEYRIRTPRGEGGFAIIDAPALTLAT